jgi:hypothetical protein
MKRQDFLKQVFTTLEEKKITGKQAFEIANEMIQDYRNIQCEHELYSTVLSLIKEQEHER